MKGAIGYWLRELVPALVDASIRRSRVTLIAILSLATVAVLFIAGHFSMTTDTAALISPKVPWRQQERAMSAAFPQFDDVMLIVVDGTTPELAEDGAVRLAARLDGDRAHFRLVRRPDGGDFFAREGLLFGSTADARAATAALIRAQPMLGPLVRDPSLRGIAAALSTILDGVEQRSATLDQIDPAMRALTRSITASLDAKPAFFSWQRLFGAEGGALAAPTRRLLLVQPILDYHSLMPGEAAAGAVTTATAALHLDDAHGVRVRLTGEVPLADEEFASLQENIGAVGALMAAAMLVTLWFATRSVRLVTAIMATIVTGLIVTTALGLVAVGRLNLISVAFIPLFVGLGVDFGIQLCVRFNAERIGGVDPPAAMRRAARALGAPLLLAAGAVFLGFGAFLPTAYVGIAELGVIAGLGMIVALAFSVTLLPALVLLLRPAVPRRQVGFAALASTDRFLERRRKAVLWVFVLLMVASIAALPWVVFDFNPMHLRNPDGTAMRTLIDLTRDPDRTPNTIDVLAPDRAHAAALIRRFEALPQVRHAIWLGSFVPQDQPAKLAAIQDAQLLLDLTLNPFDMAPTPTDTEQIAVLGGIADRLDRVAMPATGVSADDARGLAMAFRRLAHATAVQRSSVSTVLVRPLTVMLDQTRLALQATPIAATTLPAAILRDWRSSDGRYRIQLQPMGDANDNRVMLGFRDAVLGVTPAASGLPVATQAAAFTIAGAFVQAGVIALVLVGLLLFAVLRNAREVAFTLAPVVLSIFLTLGTCVAIAQPINFANIIAFPLLFGVGVAFHIYFVMAWRGGATDLLQSSLARAVLFSALATGSAFGSLWLSHHPGTASMGKILMISLVWTLICALIFEPALLGPHRDKAKA